MSKDIRAQLRMRSRAERSRWPVDEVMRRRGMMIIAQGLQSEDIKTQFKALDHLEKIEKINLKHEQLYAEERTLDVPLENLSDEQLDQMWEELNSTKFTLEALMVTTVTEIVNEQPQLLDAVYPHLSPPKLTESESNV